MSVNLFAQSLQNNGTGDIFLNGKYIDPISEESFDLSPFLKRIKIFQYIGKYKEDKDTGAKYAYHDNYLLLYIPSDELDNAGRISPILIESKFEEISDIKKTLKYFLEKSDRHISDIKISVIEKAIQYAKIQDRKKQLIKASIIYGGIAGILSGIITQSIKGVVIGTLAGVVVGTTISIANIKKDN